MPRALTGVQRGFREDDQRQRPDLLNAGTCRTTHEVFHCRHHIEGQCRSSESEHVVGAWWGEGS
jgi:hypothetical protein